MELKPTRASENSIGKSPPLFRLKVQRSDHETAFMFHIPAHVAITDYALERCSNRHSKSFSYLYSAPRPQLTCVIVVTKDIWENIGGGFLDHLQEVNRDLKAAGLPALEEHFAVAPAEVVEVNGTGEKLSSEAEALKTV